MLGFANPRTLILIALAAYPLAHASAGGPRPTILDQSKASEPKKDFSKVGPFASAGKTISDQRSVDLPGGMGLRVTIKRTEGRPEFFNNNMEGTSGIGRVGYLERANLPQKNHALDVQSVVVNPEKVKSGAARRATRPRALQSDERPTAKAVGRLEALPKDRVTLWKSGIGPRTNDSGVTWSPLSDGREFKLQMWRVNRQLVEKETKQVVTLPNGGVVIRTYTPVFRNDKPGKQPKFQYTLITQSHVSGKAKAVGRQAAKPGNHEKGKIAGRPRALKRPAYGLFGEVTDAENVIETDTEIYALGPNLDLTKVTKTAEPKPTEKVNAPVSAMWGAEQSIFAEPSMKAKALREKSKRQQLSGNDKEVDNEWLNLRERGYMPRPLIASEQILGADYFSKTVSGLKQGQHWLIVGPGRTPDEPDAYFRNSNKALRDKGYRFSGKARVTAIGTEPMTQSHKLLCQIMEGKYAYRAGKPLEKYTAKQIKKIGQADLVTDQFSAITYTDKLDLMIEKELGFVKKGGTLIFNLPGQTKILDAAGANVAATYLTAITGVTTTINTVEMGGMTHYQVKMVKNDDNPFVPRLSLAVDGYKEGSPPLRSYLFAGAAPSASVAAR